MGTNIFKRNCHTNTEITTAPNPNPSRYVILDREVIGNATVLKVRYLDCTNYEGVKVMLYKGEFDPSPDMPLDPHFQESVHSPIARFEPTEEGWYLAKMLATQL